MRDLAERVGLSDVGLKKLLTGYGVVTPPQGYWNKVLAGKPVPKCPKMPPRGPGGRGSVRVDGRFARVLLPAVPLSSSGPFASARVPEDLEELYHVELQAIGHVTVSRKLDRMHPGLAAILKKEKQRREKAAGSGWPWDGPKYDSPIDQRRLRILNALFVALSRRNHHAAACECDGRIEATAVIGDTRVNFDIVIAGAHRSIRTYGRDVPATELRVSTPLTLLIGGKKVSAGETHWHDDAAGKLEAKLTEIVARLVVVAETRFRLGLKQAEEREEQWRRFHEKQRLEEVERRNTRRLKALRVSGDLLRQAEACGRLSHGCAMPFWLGRWRWGRIDFASGSAGLRPRRIGWTRSCPARSCHTYRPAAKDPRFCHLHK